MNDQRPDAESSLVLPQTLIVTYHFVRSPTKLQRHTILEDEFRYQVEFLMSRMKPIEPEEILYALKEKKPLPDGFLLTFDDGLTEHLEFVLPFLQSMGIRGISFPNVLHLIRGEVPFVMQLQACMASLSLEDLAKRLIAEIQNQGMEINDFPKLPQAIKLFDDERTQQIKYFMNFCLTPEMRHAAIAPIFEDVAGSPESFIRNHLLNESQLRELSTGGMAIGSHTLHHHYLTSLDSEKKFSEINVASNYLADITGEKCRFFAYPYGHLDDGCIDTLARVGVEAAFTTWPRIERFPHPHKIGRLDTIFLPPLMKRPMPSADEPLIEYNTVDGTSATDPAKRVAQSRA